MTKEALIDFLKWSVTPQSDSEQKKFKEEGLVDDYIDLINRIPLMSEQELVKEINIQLAPYGLQVDTNNPLK